jgi:hypothetical protein
LNSDYNRVVTHDIEVSVGDLFSGWNPLAHSQYWTDNSFTKPVAQLLFETWRDSQPAAAAKPARTRKTRQKRTS